MISTPATESTRSYTPLRRAISLSLFLSRVGQSKRGAPVVQPYACAISNSSRQKLLRDAADVDAGAAEEMRFGDGDFDALGGRDAAGAYAAGTAA
jgi:hypothetical protein